MSKGQRQKNLIKILVLREKGERKSTFFKQENNKEIIF